MHRKMPYKIHNIEVTLDYFIFKFYLFPKYASMVMCFFFIYEVNSIFIIFFYKGYTIFGIYLVCLRFLILEKPLLEKDLVKYNYYLDFDLHHMVHSLPIE